ncbi:hypothetical protein NEICINOT_05058 [Neisseria cinerea ATCC 14685]|uniref:Uncharacterized protein n=1 Tax=Neisseria cinerea ATCC 14685 TaxID=546262 RepID=D0W5T7_NEICI|nr:hypothetical protein NEICINOT_05058 [Neisseria cinerea ATCC 14685]
MIQLSNAVGKGRIIRRKGLGCLVIWAKVLTIFRRHMVGGNTGAV